MHRLHYQIARVLARSLGEPQVFCDLFSSHASVLGHNVSGQVAARFKHAALANVATLAQRIDFEQALETMVATLISGTLVRTAVIQRS